MSQQGHNSGDAQYNVTAEELRQFIERHEHRRPFGAGARQTGASAMNEQTTMTMRIGDGPEIGPFTEEQLTAAASVFADELIVPAAELVLKERKASTSLIQRRFAISYNRAARVAEALEELGIITAADHVGKREVVGTELPHALAAAAAAKAHLGKKIPMKPDPDFAAAEGKAYSVTGAELRQFVERVERLQQEQRDLKDDEKKVFSEMKGRDYDTKVIRKVIAIRKRDADDLAEEEAVLDMYKAALGMA